MARIADYARSIASGCLDLLFPRGCAVCEVPLAAGRKAEARWLCDACMQGIVFTKAPYCARCGESYDGSMAGSFRCGNCAKLKLHFDFAISACQAEGIPRELIHRFKYRRQLYLRGVLGALLQHVFKDSRLEGIQTQDWLLVPVPLYFTRQWKREYNQSWELCRTLSGQTGIPARRLLRRLRATSPQARLSRAKRLENLRGAFGLRRWLWHRDHLKGKQILLVDDVLTTGSTASACAQILLKQAGVQKVVVITVARG